MKPKSDNLFHFTKDIEVLKLILKNGIYPRYCLEDFSWAKVNDFDYVAYPMSCFCDIPLSRISEHTDFYGDYGIGFTKAWGLNNNLNPIIYLTPNSSIRDVIKHFLEHDNDHTKTKSKDNGNQKDHLFTLISQIKPIIGTMLVNGNSIEKEFYQENEWRFVPDVENIILKDDFEKDKDAENKKIENFKLTFTPRDVRYIFVKSDNDIPELIDFITANLGYFPHNDLKILQSRIISIETLRTDL